MKSLAVIYLTALAAALTGCRPAPKVDEQAVLETVRANVAAMQREDLAGVMSTVHSESPAAQTTGEQISELFEQTSLRYSLSDLKIVEANASEARVRFTQTTKSADAASDVNANTITGEHLLRSENGQWKIFSTQLAEIKQLDP
ncbi:MAG TPA: hypothetical protein VGO90_17945 [Chthoniobacteraceae bacterium]|jgi:hypothetical protein|nr:hypothetical protein [Chthoniobacter sp.]HEV7869578.1 hypothetical protein [Chthoniobacteraceae bacterium]